jgi:hypothetical protein
MSAATTKQIEMLNKLEREILDIISKAKNSKYENQIKRALSGVETVVEKARKSGDKAAYSTAIGMLLRRKKFVQNYVR